MAAWGGLVPRQRRRGAAAGPASTPGLHMLARCAEAYVEDSGYLGAVDALEAVSEACAWAEARGRDWLFLARLEDASTTLRCCSAPSCPARRFLHASLCGHRELGAGERELRWREGAAAHLRHHFDARLLRRCAGAAPEEEAAGGSGGPGGGREPLEGALCRYLRWRAAPCGGGLSLLPPAAPAPDEVRVVSTSGDLAAGVQRGAPPAASSRPMLNDLMFRKRPIAQG
ncbi:unnamed protein product [Prorocentrum cordatum]|uniref:Uncharacterized protein n=1 Tax=Prorocentrum cordatum TaxID=2364126 RepID=A0ABN9X2V3_9DINO|nr:unnamed protein product [Polarella glacialis]